MKIPINKILVALLILVVIPFGCLLYELQQVHNRISVDDLSYSGTYESLILYYVAMTVVVAGLYIIKKIVAVLNKEK